MGEWHFNAKESIKVWAWIFSAVTQVVLIILFFTQVNNNTTGNPISYVVNDIFIVGVAWLCGATVGVVIEAFKAFKRFTKKY